MQPTQPRARATLPVRRVQARALGREAIADDRLTIGSDAGNDLVLADPTVSRFHVELRRSGRGIDVRDLGSTNGVRVGELTLSRGSVAPGTVLTLGAVQVEVLDGGLGELELSRELPDLVAVAPATRATLARVERAARSDLSVFFTGESGTGKERFAEALHALGPRAEQPFVVVDCGAVPLSLLPSELFGHEKGAFTGANSRRIGALERAEAGTVFLDEVAELGAEAAQLLSGVLARKTFRRVGGSVELPLHARIVAASHRDLFRLSNEGLFPADLLHRLAAIRIHVPPLRERLEDLPLLVERFARAAGHRESDLSEATRASFAQHAWPGNVRELRLAVLAELATNEPVELPHAPPRGAFGEVLGLPFREARDQTMARFTHDYLARLLARTKENVAEAARVASLERTHLHDLLKRHGLR